MPRPSRNLTRTSVYLPADDLTELDALAETYGVTRSDVMRLALDVADAELLLEERERESRHEKSPPPPKG